MKNEKTSDLEYHLGYWLRFVSNHVSGSFRERIANYDVTVAEWVALRSLWNKGPCTLNDVAKQIGIDAGATSRLIERLIQKKLATRRVGATDRRSVSIDLTAAGKALVPKLAKEADKNDDYFFDPLSKQDKDHLLRIMKNLVKTHNLTEKPTN